MNYGLNITYSDDSQSKISYSKRKLNEKSIIEDDYVSNEIEITYSSYTQYKGFVTDSNGNLIIFWTERVNLQESPILKITKISPEGNIILISKSYSFPEILYYSSASNNVV
ncbi:MAG: hypothetical protein ACXAC7_18915, partial [Candidatus Hodarchaeales archaeon]